MRNIFKSLIWGAEKKVSIKEINNPKISWTMPQDEKELALALEKQQFINNLHLFESQTAKSNLIICAADFLYEPEAFDRFVGMIITRFCPNLRLNCYTIRINPYISGSWKIEFDIGWFDSESGNEDPYIVVEERELFDFVRSTIKILNVS